MHNSPVHKKHTRGSSSLQATENRAEPCVTVPAVKHGIRSNVLPIDASGPVRDDGVTRLRSVRGNQDVSLWKKPEDVSTPRDLNADSRPDGERRHPSLQTSLWQDEGGESGEGVL